MGGGLYYRQLQYDNKIRGRLFRLSKNVGSNNHKEHQRRKQQPENDGGNVNENV